MRPYTPGRGIVFSSFTGGSGWALTLPEAAIANKINASCPPDMHSLNARRQKVIRVQNPNQSDISDPPRACFVLGRNDAERSIGRGERFSITTSHQQHGMIFESWIEFRESKDRPGIIAMTDRGINWGWGAFDDNESQEPIASQSLSKFNAHQRSAQLGQITCPWAW
jgi:hypothetical protein